MLNWALHYQDLGGSGGTAQSISNIDTRWGWAVTNWIVLPRNTAIYYHSYASIKTHQIKQLDDSCKSSSHTSRYVPVIWWAVLQKVEKLLVQYHLKCPTHFTTHSPASDNNTFSTIAKNFSCITHTVEHNYIVVFDCMCNTQKIFCYWTNTTGMTHLKKNSQLV